jgi:hypothetical protein
MQLGRLSCRPAARLSRESATSGHFRAAAAPRRASGAAGQQPTHASTLRSRCRELQRCRAAPDAGAGDAEDESQCFINEIAIDNKTFPSYTKLHLEAPEYPGLLRVVSWVLNGELPGS